MARLVALILATVVALSSAFVAPSASAAVGSQSRAAVNMFGGSSKAVAKKAPAKKAVAKKAPARGKSSTEGKGGIFPWVTNTPGSMSRPPHARVHHAADCPVLYHAPPARALHPFGSTDHPYLTS